MLPLIKMEIFLIFVKPNFQAASFYKPKDAPWFRNESFKDILDKRIPS
jgi:hypothetical protein